MVTNHGHLELESIKLTEKNSVNLAREVEMLEAEVDNVSTARKRTEGPSVLAQGTMRERCLAVQETAADNDGVQQKPSTSARVKDAKRRRFREIFNRNRRSFSCRTENN